MNHFPKFNIKEKETSRVERQKGRINKEAKCFFCDSPCNEEDHYCYGCCEFICNKCDEVGVEVPFGSHFVEEHRFEEIPDE